MEDKKKLFESIKKKSSILKIVALLMAALSGVTYYLSESIESDAEKGIIALDQQVLK